MNDIKEKNIELLSNQIIVSLLFIGTIIVSISLTYDERQNLLNESRLYTNKQVKTLSIINRIVIVLLGLYYLYDNYEHIKFSKLENKDSSDFDLQEIASILNFIGAIIVLYVVSKNNQENFNLLETENPIL